MTPLERAAQLLCAAITFIGFVIVYRLLTRRPPAESACAGDGWSDAAYVPPPACPACRYDLRASTAACPECGAPVSEAARLRADLLTGRPPEWMLDPAHARPARTAGDDEAWVPVSAVVDLAQVRPLQALLERAGVDQRASLRLIPTRTDFLGAPTADAPLAGVVEVPGADWDLANELALYVRHEHAGGRLDGLIERFGLPPADADRVANDDDR